MVKTNPQYSMSRSDLIKLKKDIETVLKTYTNTCCEEFTKGREQLRLINERLERENG